MTAAAMTFNSLVSDISIYTNRSSDESFISQIPRFIMLAEARIASEVSGLGYIEYVTGDFTLADPVLSKPAGWRETISFQIGLTNSPTAKRKTIYERSFEFCRVYWPSPDLTGLPKYFADYDYENFLIVPTPNLAYPFELAFRKKPTPLDSTNQENWTTKYAPSLILYAALLETAPFLRNDERLVMFQNMYDRAAAAVTAEDKKRRSQTGRG